MIERIRRAFASKPVRGRVLSVAGGRMRVATPNGVRVLEAISGVRAGDTVTLKDGAVSAGATAAAEVYYL